MGQVVTYANNKFQCFCQVKLDSGERVLISIAGIPTPSVKFIRLALLGLLPRETIWEYSAAKAGSNDAYVENLARMFYDPLRGLQLHPLDQFRDAVLPLKSIAEVRSWFGQAESRALKN